MSRTTEQLAHTAFLASQLEAAEPRVRLVPDAEGFPIVPGRFGQVECYGAEWSTGETRLRNGYLTLNVSVPYGMSSIVRSTVHLPGRNVDMGKLHHAVLHSKSRVVP